MNDQATPTNHPDVLVGVTADDVGAAAEFSPECLHDEECQNPLWCNNDGRCVEPVDDVLVRPMLDGMTRAGVATFDLVPEQFDPWHDRASDLCPLNRPGHFDGQLDVPKPDDPCLDAFDDLNGDGVFNAVWLGGPTSGRPATSVDDENPPEGRVVVLTRDDLVIVLISLDLYVLGRGQLEALTTQLSHRLGLPQTAFTVHTTGSRSGPDAMGLSGPSWHVAPQAWRRNIVENHPEDLNLLMDLPLRSGVNPLWWGEFVRRSAAAVRRAAGMRQAIQVRHATAHVPIQRQKYGAGAQPSDRGDRSEFDHDATLLERWRNRTWPFVRSDHIPGQVDDTLRIVSLDSTSSQRPHIILAGWGAAPGMSTSSKRLSADYPGHVRRRLESSYPGATAVWLTSAAADTHVSDDDVFVPEVSVDGDLLGPDGEPVDDALRAHPAADRIGALTRLVSARLVKALDTAPVHRAELGYRTRSVWVPVGNPRIALAASLGLLPQQRAWFTGQMPTNAWVSHDVAPACGGLGCVRYRLDHIALGQQIRLVMAPGGLDQSFVSGRRGLTVHYGDERNYRDIDGDGRADHEDDDGIVLSARIGRDTRNVEVEQSVNPQTFAPVIGLGDENTWLIGRTNGGWGSFRSAGERINVFEGQIDGLVDLASDPHDGLIRLADLGYSVRGDLTLSDLSERLIDRASHVLANLTASHELLCGVDMPDVEGPVRWILRDAGGALLAEGDDLVLGPGAKVYSPSVNFTHLNIPSGSQLFLPDMRGAGWRVMGVVPLTLREHPNAADAWVSAASSGGDYIYNGLCELLASDGRCETSRPVRRDPNPHLPRMRHSFP